MKTTILRDFSVVIALTHNSSVAIVNIVSTALKVPQVVFNNLLLPLELHFNLNILGWFDVMSEIRICQTMVPYLGLRPWF